MESPLAWAVIFSIDSRRPTHCRHVTKIPSPQLLLFPALANRDACNPFRIRSYANCRVAYALVLRSSIFRTLFQVPYPATPLFATLAKTAGVCTNNSHSGTHPAVAQAWLTSLLPYFFTSFSHRKQHRLSGRRIGNSLQLRVLPAKRLRHLYLQSRQAVDDLQRIDAGLALKVIVGDHQRLPRPLPDFPDERNPGRQLFGGVEIVVALMRGNPCVVTEPRVVAPPVKPHVPDGRGSLSGRRKRSPDDGLVDVAETDAAAVQQFQRFGRIPRSVANLDHQRVVSKSPYYGGEVRYGLRSAMKRKRECQQHPAQPLRPPNHIQPPPHAPLLLRGRAGCCGSDVVRESLPEFGGKNKARIRRHSIDPLRRVLGTQRLVKRSV